MPRVPRPSVQPDEDASVQSTLLPGNPEKQPASDGSAISDKERDFSPPENAGPAFPSRKIPDKKLYQDEIYGTKELSPLAVAVIDTPEFQRLARIYQLGFTNTVFRGATHRRFDHSVGTYFIVRTLMRRIVQNHARFYDFDPEAFCHPGLMLSPRLYVAAPGSTLDSQAVHGPMGRWRGLTDLVSVAALLHDLGHIPIGHTLEDEFTVFEKHDSLGGPRLFEMLYGPRTATTDAPTSDQPRVECFFGPIDVAKLPRPSVWLRAPLPWVFEHGFYDRFFRDAVTSTGGTEVRALENWEIRDVIYLILSFKETVERDRYLTFRQELSIADEHARKTQDIKLRKRLEFIRALIDYYSAPIHVGDRYPSAPLFHPFMADVVGNTICGDLLDYLVRDGRRLALDTRDGNRLQRYLVIRSSSALVPRASSPSEPRQARRLPATDDEQSHATDGDKRLTVFAASPRGLRRRDTVSELLDLMGERYRFAEVVYYHAKKAAFSTMLAKGIELLNARCDGEILDHRDGVYPAPWSGPSEPARAVPHVAHFGDDDILTYLVEKASTTGFAGVTALIRGIIYRNEYRLLFTLDWDAAEKAGGPAKFLENLRDSGTNDAGRKQLEADLATLVKRSPIGRWITDEPPVLVYCPNIKMQAKEVAAHVELVRNKVIPLNRQSEDSLRGEIDVLNKKYQQLWRLYLFVHPRLLEEGSREERETLFNGLVDSFCEKYGVPESDRSRGGRVPYMSMDRRIDKFLVEWLGKYGWARCKEERIRDLLKDRKLWAASSGVTDGGAAVAQEDFARAFALACSLVGVEEAPTSSKSDWPEELRRVEAEALVTESQIPVENRARRAALERLRSFAGSLVSESREARLPIASWDDMVSALASDLGQLKPSAERKDAK